MKLHTSLTGRQVIRALYAAQAAGHVTPDVGFTEYSQGRSRTHDRRFEIQLGTYNRDSLPEGTMDQSGALLRVRRYKDSGTAGSGPLWAATYDEWGWFMAAVFAMDPGAVFGSPGGQYGYHGAADFRAKTGGRFGPAPEAGLTWVTRRVRDGEVLETGFGSRAAAAAWIADNDYLPGRVEAVTVLTAEAVTVLTAADMAS